MVSFKFPEIKKFSVFSVFSFFFGIIGLFVEPLSILAIACGIAGLVQISSNPDIKFKEIAKTLAIIGVVLGTVAAIFLITDLITMRGVFKTMADLRDDLITYFGKKSEDIVGNISDLINITGGLEGI